MTPTYVHTTKRTALEQGAALFEREAAQLRQHAILVDAVDRQRDPGPNPQEAERTLLQTMHLVQCATILRMMADQEPTT